ncbi:MAG: efflux RND transporter periplasmic adaptor subunit [Clostridia bacterium]|nr:efflux RND transporter periplasmic adaptor subunit [Clostridia bacterium]
MNGGSLGNASKLTGVVEPQSELKVEKDDSKKIAKVYVEEGDEVKAGDILFEYDVDAIELSLEQAKLELDTIVTRIDTLEKTLESLQAEKLKASEDQQLQYSLEIQSAELDIKQEQYNKVEKESEIVTIEDSLKNTEVKSEIDGIIKSVKKTNNDDYGGSSDNAFIKILSLGNYRVKGTVSELNRQSIWEGMNVVVRSRVDENAMWKATIISIANQADENNNSDMGFYYGYGSGGDSASNYTFYAELENMEGLMLGQHVYVEEDNGQSEARNGIWIPSYYINTEDSTVWAAQDGGRLFRTKVSLGEYDEQSDVYQIVSGLTEDMYLAFPMDIYVDGMSTTTDYSASLAADDIIPSDNVFPEYDDYDSFDEGAFDEGAFDAGEYEDDFADADFGGDEVFG